MSGSDPIPPPQVVDGLIRVVDCRKIPVGSKYLEIKTFGALEKAVADWRIDGVMNTLYCVCYALSLRKLPADFSQRICGARPEWPALYEYAKTAAESRARAEHTINLQAKRLVEMGKLLSEEAERIGSMLVHSYPDLPLVETLYRNPNLFIYFTETRPLLRGFRLTSHVLNVIGCKGRLITDNMAAFCIKRYCVEAVVLSSYGVSKTMAVCEPGSLALALASKHLGAKLLILPLLGEVSEERVRALESMGYGEEVMRLFGRRITPRSVGFSCPRADLVPLSYASRVLEPE